MAARQNYPLDHATHMPVLVSIAKSFKIKSVLEFGAGVYSTPLFLDKKFFPDLERILSIEPEQEWRDKVISKTGEDARLTFLSNLPAGTTCQFCDLVLVDNGPEQHKIDTIKEMKNIAPSCLNTLFVVHDAEHAPYLSLIVQFPYYKIYSKMNPETAVCSALPINWSVDSVEGW